MTEWRRIHTRPQSAPVGHDDQEPPARRQHTPRLAQERGRVVRHFQRVHQQHAIDRAVGQGQFILVDQRRKRRTRGRPFHHALSGRHEGEAAFGFLAEQAEIRRGVADAKHTHTGGIAPQSANTAADESARHHAEALAVKVA